MTAPSQTPPRAAELVERLEYTKKSLEMLHILPETIVPITDTIAHLRAAPTSPVRVALSADPVKGCVDHAKASQQHGQESAAPTVSDGGEWAVKDAIDEAFTANTNRVADCLNAKEIDGILAAIAPFLKHAPASATGAVAAMRVKELVHELAMKEAELGLETKLSKDRAARIAELEEQFQHEFQHHTNARNQVHALEAAAREKDNLIAKLTEERK